MQKTSSEMTPYKSHNNDLSANNLYSKFRNDKPLASPPSEMVATFKKSYSSSAVATQNTTPKPYSKYPKLPPKDPQSIRSSPSNSENSRLQFSVRRANERPDLTQKITPNPVLENKYKASEHYRFISNPENSLNTPTSDFSSQSNEDPYEDTGFLSESSARISSSSRRKLHNQINLNPKPSYNEISTQSFSNNSLDDYIQNERRKLKAILHNENSYNSDPDMLESPSTQRVFRYSARSHKSRPRLRFDQNHPSTYLYSNANSPTSGSSNPNPSFQSRYSAAKASASRNAKNDEELPQIGAETSDSESLQNSEKNSILILSNVLENLDLDAVSSGSNSEDSLDDGIWFSNFDKNKINDNIDYNSKIIEENLVFSPLNALVAQLTSELFNLIVSSNKNVNAENKQPPTLESSKEVTNSSQKPSFNLNKALPVIPQNKDATSQNDYSAENPFGSPKWVDEILSKAKQVSFVDEQQDVSILSKLQVIPEIEQLDHSPESNFKADNIFTADNSKSKKKIENIITNLPVISSPPSSELSSNEKRYPNTPSSEPKFGFGQQINLKANNNNLDQLTKDENSTKKGDPFASETYQQSNQAALSTSNSAALSESPQTGFRSRDPAGPTRNIARNEFFAKDKNKMDNIFDSNDNQTISPAKIGLLRALGRRQSIRLAPNLGKIILAETMIKTGGELYSENSEEIQDMVKVNLSIALHLKNTPNLSNLSVIPNATKISYENELKASAKKPLLVKLPPTKIFTTVKPKNLAELEDLAKSVGGILYSTVDDSLCYSGSQGFCVSKSQFFSKYYFGSFYYHDFGSSPSIASKIRAGSEILNNADLELDKPELKKQILDYYDKNFKTVMLPPPVPLRVKRTSVLPKSKHFIVTNTATSSDLLANNEVTGFYFNRENNPSNSKPDISTELKNSIAGINSILEAKQIEPRKSITQNDSFINNSFKGTKFSDGMFFSASTNNIFDSRLDYDALSLNQGQNGNRVLKPIRHSNIFLPKSPPSPTVKHNDPSSTNRVQRTIVLPRTPDNKSPVYISKHTNSSDNDLSFAPRHEYKASKNRNNLTIDSQTRINASEVYPHSINNSPKAIPLHHSRKTPISESKNYASFDGNIRTSSNTDIPPAFTSSKLRDHRDSESYGYDAYSPVLDRHNLRYLAPRARRLLLHGPAHRVISVLNAQPNGYFFLFSDVLVITRAFIYKDPKLGYLPSQDSRSPKYPSSQINDIAPNYTFSPIMVIPLVKNITSLSTARNVTRSVEINVGERKHSNSRKLEKKLKEIAHKFNSSPSNAIIYLIDNQIITPQPEKLADFLIRCTQLHRLQLGNLICSGLLARELGEDATQEEIVRESKYYLSVWSTYLDRYNLAGIPIDEAIRQVFLGIRLPSDPIAVNFLLEKFSIHWFNKNRPIADAYQNLSKACASMLLSSYVDSNGASSGSNARLNQLNVQSGKKLNIDADGEKQGPKGHFNTSAKKRGSVLEVLNNDKTSKFFNFIWVPPSLDLTKRIVFALMTLNAELHNPLVCADIDPEVAFREFVKKFYVQVPLNTPVPENLFPLFIDSVYKSLSSSNTSVPVHIIAPFEPHNKKDSFLRKKDQHQFSSFTEIPLQELYSIWLRMKSAKIQQTTRGKQSSVSLDWNWIDYCSAFPEEIPKINDSLESLISSNSSTHFYSPFSIDHKKAMDLLKYPPISEFDLSHKYSYLNDVYSDPGFKDGLLFNTSTDKIPSKFNVANPAMLKVSITIAEPDPNYLIAVRVISSSTTLQHLNSDAGLTEFSKGYIGDINKSGYFSIVRTDLIMGDNPNTAEGNLKKSNILSLNCPLDTMSHDNYNPNSPIAILPLDVLSFANSRTVSFFIVPKSVGQAVLQFLPYGSNAKNYSPLPARTLTVEGSFMLHILQFTLSKPTENQAPTSATYANKNPNTSTPSPYTVPNTSKSTNNPLITPLIPGKNLNSENMDTEKVFSQNLAKSISQVRYMFSSLSEETKLRWFSEITSVIKANSQLRNKEDDPFEVQGSNTHGKSPSEYSTARNPSYQDIFEANNLSENIYKLLIDRAKVINQPGFYDPNEQPNSQTPKQSQLLGKELVALVSENNMA
ncbi:hypothetical protein BB560_004400 [Smittium megazygosporum]|uniref:SEC7 domain-containing protein n=1 Tax=Smittium megazygosporum TaxID=133381 RepID=A0A2T9Z9H3_9FUNG|nr:hypothetical protein BB560_004400 [Smittium megazygosporum]